MNELQLLMQWNLLEPDRCFLIGDRRFLVYASWNRGKPMPDYVAARSEAVRSVNLLTKGGQK